MTETDRPAFLGRRIPDGFGVRRITVPPGTERRTVADEWHDAIVILERGAIEVVEPSGGRRTFTPGDMLCLQWVACERIVNVGSVDAELIAIHRSPPHRAARSTPHH